MLQRSNMVKEEKISPKMVFEKPDVGTRANFIPQQTENVHLQFMYNLRTF